MQNEKGLHLEMAIGLLMYVSSHKINVKIQSIKLPMIYMEMICLHPLTNFSSIKEQIVSLNADTSIIIRSQTRYVHVYGSIYIFLSIVNLRGPDRMQMQFAIAKSTQAKCLYTLSISGCGPFKKIKIKIKKGNRRWRVWDVCRVVYTRCTVHVSIMGYHV